METGSWYLGWTQWAVSMLNLSMILFVLFSVVSDKPAVMVLGAVSDWHRQNKEVFDAAANDYVTFKKKNIIYSCKT